MVEKIAPHHEPEETPPSVVLFDLDGTLGKDSRTRPSDSTVAKFSTLADFMPVALVSSSSFERINDFMLKRLPPSNKRTMWVFSESGGRCDMWKDGAWVNVFQDELEKYEREGIERVIRKTVRDEADILEHVEGHILKDRKSSMSWIAFADNGEEQELKKNEWDPDLSKRLHLRDALQKQLPEYRVVITGRTTVSVSKKSKADAVTILSQPEFMGHKFTNQRPWSMKLFGDGFSEGGNDADALSTAIEGHETTGPEYTEKSIDGYLAWFTKRARGYQPQE